MNFALQFRMEFGRDVFIDLLGYRKYGHNEGDEPRFTQPKLYKAISEHKNPRDIYADKIGGTRNHKHRLLEPIRGKCKV